jgi:rfaE bifunctional protein kinase chain/domain/rfaE bifunctional protein nucleotidyltransferase chain/domain
MTLSDKIIDLPALAGKAETLRDQGKRVVLCHGTFDLLHVGHVHHLQQAREQGDVLLVTVTADEHVNKGPGRPVFNARLRAEHLAALVSVEYVAINEELTSVNVIDAVKPDVYVKGSDYKDHESDITGNILREKHAVEAHGGKIFYTDGVTFSSSKLLNDYFEVFSEQTKAYLKGFKRKYSAADVHGTINALNHLNVLVIGDAIIDEYHYTEPLGQTGKYNVLSVKYKSREQFAGGSIAVANHAAGLAQKVTLFTGLGEVRSHEDFIRSKLKHNVQPEFLYFKDSPTLVKRRYVDGEMAKLFEVYHYNDSPMNDELERRACQWLDENVARYDAVIVPDFGNGLISDNMVKVICDKARFLAVNTQLNSGNRGYHAISRYTKADFVSLNEPEIRMATHNRHGNLEDIAEEVSDMVKARYVAVTRGKRGIDMFDCDQAHAYHVPALSTKVIDRIGAGDAFLSFAGTILAGAMDSRLAAFVGAAAAALDVQIVCNREPVDVVSLQKYVTTLLK